MLLDGVAAEADTVMVKFKIWSRFMWWLEKAGKRPVFDEIL